MTIAVAARYTHAKQVVPHYYLSVELDLSKLLKFRNEMNHDNKNISVLDILIKASAMAIKQVPDVNGKLISLYFYYL